MAAAAEAAQHLMAFWASRGPFGDVRRLLTSLAELAPADSLARGRLLWVAAVMAASQNDYDGCVELSAESLRIGTEVKDPEVVAWSLMLADLTAPLPSLAAHSGCAKVNSGPSRPRPPGPGRPQS